MPTLYMALLSIGPIISFPYRALYVHLLYGPTIHNIDGSSRKLNPNIKAGFGGYQLRGGVDVC